LTETQEAQPRPPKIDDDGITRAPHTQAPSHPANSYWDWPNTERDIKQQIIDQILKEEQARQLLSIEHQEETLKQQEQAQAKAETIRCSKASTPDEDYWFLPTKDKVVVERNANHPSQSYWDWPARRTPQEEKQDLIASILQEEQCRRLLSIEQMQANLQQQPKHQVGGTSTTQPEHDSYWNWSVVQAGTNDGYWEWPTRTTGTAEEEKQHTIQQILKEEQIRNRLSVEHIESKLVHQAPASLKMVASSGGDQPYWDW
jgi:hypothetical protein